MPSAPHHVVFAVTNYPPRRGGVETHVQSLAKALVARGHRCTVIALGSAPGIRDDEGVVVHTLRRHADLGGILALPTPWAWRRTARVVLGDATHVSVHTRFFPMTWLGLRAARRRSLPVIHTEHGADHVRTASRPVNAAARLVDVTAGRWSLRRADRVLTVSAEVGAFVARLAGRDSEVLGNGVTLSRWRTVPTPPPVPRLVFVGRLVDEKGWSAFLDVVAAARAVHLDLTAIVAGEGPRREAVVAGIAARGLGGAVTGPVLLDADSLAAAAAGAIYVNPTMAAEGFQLTLPETVAAGARVVTYAVSGAQTLQEAGAPVRIVPRGDAVALTAAVLDELARPSPPADLIDLAPWDWAAVADRYIGVLDGSRS